MTQSRDRIPMLDLLFGFGPALLLLAAGLAAWALPLGQQRVAIAGGWLWGSAILLFLAGVTRGLSFFTPGGPRTAQIVQMLWLFLLAFGALSVSPGPAFVLLILGYASVALFDGRAARSGMAPAHFARLRPPQSAIFVAGLLLLLFRTFG